MTNSEFDLRVVQLWAAHFGCEAGDFGHQGTMLLPRERLRGKNVIHIVYIRKRAMAEIDPVLQTPLEDALGKRRVVLSSELLLRAWGRERLREVDAGLVFHLRPGSLVHPLLDSQFTLRRLTLEDAMALQALKGRCTQFEVDDGFVELEHELAWGCFKQAQLVAVGSAYARNGFMDYGVLTDPAFRGQGLARHVVVGLSEDTVARGLIPQYRCNRVNQASRRVAEAAGFTLYFTTESIYLSD